MKTTLIYAALATNALLAMNAQADLDANVNVTTKESDNAKKKVDDVYSERQTIYQANLNGDYKNEWIQATTQYLGTQYEFERDSQPSKSTLEGKAQLEVGASTDPLHLSLGHLRRTVLNQPDSVVTPLNLDERDTFTAQPSAQWRLTSSDLIRTSINYSKVTYRLDESKDASTQGAGVAWMHLVNASDSFGLTWQVNQVKFDNFPAVNYDYNSLSAQYSVKLHHLGYVLSAGYNEVNQANNSYTNSSPTYSANLNYKTGQNTFYLNADRRITDNSSGEPSSIGGMGLPSDSGRKGIQIVNLTTTNASWSSQLLCERCETRVSFMVSEKNYKQTGQIDRDKSASLGVSYKLTRKLQFSLEESRVKKTFVGGGPVNNFTLVRDRISFSYKVADWAQASVFKERENRESNDVLQNYIENVVGLNATIRF